MASKVLPYGERICLNCGEEFYGTYRYCCYECFEEKQEQLANRPYELQAEALQYPSPPEEKLSQLLDVWGWRHEAQHIISVKYRVDEWVKFAPPLYIEVDGAKWHEGKEEKDAKRDADIVEDRDGYAAIIHIPADVIFRLAGEPLRLLLMGLKTVCGHEPIRIFSASGCRIMIQRERDDKAFTEEFCETLLFLPDDWEWTRTNYGLSFHTEARIWRIGGKDVLDGDHKQTITA